MIMLMRGKDEGRETRDDIYRETRGFTWHTCLYMDGLRRLYRRGLLRFWGVGCISLRDLAFVHKVLAWDDAESVYDYGI